MLVVAVSAGLSVLHTVLLSNEELLLITLFVLAENPFSVVSRTNYGVFQRLVCVEVEKFNFHS